MKEKIIQWMNPLAASTNNALPTYHSGRRSFRYNEAYNYYEEKSSGLGERFLQELIQRYNEITAHHEFDCL